MWEKSVSASTEHESAKQQKHCTILAITVDVFFCACDVDISKIPLQEEPDVRLAIQEALSMMVGAYANLQGALLNLMEALVAAYIAKVRGRIGRISIHFCWFGY